MIIPCIDLMDGKVVQLVQGREKELEGDEPMVMLERFREFPIIQVIDLDAAIGRGANDAIVEQLAAHALTRVGGGVRTVERAQRLIEQGVDKVIVGTSAFKADGPDEPFLQALANALGPDRIRIALDSMKGQIVIKGWRESLNLTAEEILPRLEPYCGGFLCTYVDKEGMLQGTDLPWYRRLRAATQHELTAAGGITTMEEIRELQSMNIHAALGMAIYKGVLPLSELASMNQ